MEGGRHRSGAGVQGAGLQVPLLCRQLQRRLHRLSYLPPQAPAPPGPHAQAAAKPRPSWHSEDRPGLEQVDEGSVEAGECGTYPGPPTP